MTEEMTKSHCQGCEDDFYNHRQSGCWLYSEAKLIKRKRVSVEQMPPWNQEAEILPSCYHVKRYIFVSPERKN